MAYKKCLYKVKNKDDQFIDGKINYSFNSFGKIWFSMSSVKRYLARIQPEDDWEILELEILPVAHKLYKIESGRTTHG